jgi:23S rRNA (adenine1618-N6)-methyltransferase
MVKNTSARLHPRNRHGKGYDFSKLKRVNSRLAAFIRTSPQGRLTIDFSDNQAVLELNRALLMSDYAIDYWDIPKGYLCPPIPGRADYIHCLADLLMSRGVKRQSFDQVRVLDIGTGANLIYPIIGISEYDWAFSGSEVDPISLENILKLKTKNRLLDKFSALKQDRHDRVFEGVIGRQDFFHLTMCNPPFHASQEEAELGSKRKNANLNLPSHKGAGHLNFGGQRSELWCPGGELGFIRRMIRESAHHAGNVGWFTCLVSKKENLPLLRKALKKVPVKETKTVTMTQGQKVSRFLAWTFQ